MDESIATYWRDVLERVDKPSAKRLLIDLDLSHPLGVRRASPAKKSSSPPMYEFFLETKGKHPFAVLLVRVRQAPCWPNLRWLLARAAGIGCYGP